MTAVAAVLMRDRLTAGIVGLMISHTMSVIGSLHSLVMLLSEVETDIVSVERIDEYAHLTPEAPWEISANKPSCHWPIRGNIQ